MLKELNDEHLLCLRLVAKAPGEPLLPGVFPTRDEGLCRAVKGRLVIYWDEERKQQRLAIYQWVVKI